MWFCCSAFGCFCLLGGAPWVDKNYGRLLRVRWPQQLLMPSINKLEDTLGCSTPVEWERTSRRTVGPTASLVTESLSSLPRLRGRVRTRCCALAPMIPPRGWEELKRAATVVVASQDRGDLRLRPLLQVCRSACIACTVIRVQSCTTHMKWRKGCILFKTCEKESCTFCENKGFESTLNACLACIAWWHQWPQWLTASGSCAFTRKEVREGHAFWPNEAVGESRTFDQIKGFEPTSTACIACRAWHPQEVQWPKSGISMPKVPEDTRLVQWWWSSWRTACEPAQEGHEKADERLELAALAQHMWCASMRPKGSNMASGDKCDLVTRHTWEECESCGHVNVWMLHCMVLTGPSGS